MSRAYLETLRKDSQALKHNECLQVQESRALDLLKFEDRYMLASCVAGIMIRQIRRFLKRNDLIDIGDAGESS